MVEHRVPADAVGIGRFDHDVAGQQGDFGLILVVGIMGEAQRLVETDRVTAVKHLMVADADDAAFLGLRVVEEIIAASAAAAPLALGGCDDDHVVPFPAFNRLGDEDG